METQRKHGEDHEITVPVTGDARRPSQGARAVLATATFEADRAKLEKRRHEIDDAIKGEVDEFDSAVREAAAAGRTSWNETKASMKRPLDEIRARIDKRQSEHESIERCAPRRRQRRTWPAPSKLRRTS